MSEMASSKTSGGSAGLSEDTSLLNEDLVSEDFHNLALDACNDTLVISKTTQDEDNVDMSSIAVYSDSYVESDNKVICETQDKDAVLVVADHTEGNSAVRSEINSSDEAASSGGSVQSNNKDTCEEQGKNPVHPEDHSEGDSAVFSEISSSGEAASSDVLVQSDKRDKCEEQGKDPVLIVEDHNEGDRADRSGISDSITRNNMDHIVEPADSTPSDAGKFSNIDEGGTCVDPAKMNQGDECGHLKKTESSGGQCDGVKKKSRKNGQNRRKKKSTKDISDDEIDITFEVQSIGDSVNLLRMPGSHSMPIGRSSQPADNCVQGAYGYGHDDEMAVPWMFRSSYQGVPTDAHHLDHGYGYHMGQANNGGGYSRGSQYGDSLGMGRGRGCGRGMYSGPHQPAMYDRYSPGSQYGYQRSHGHGRGLTNYPHHTFKGNDTDGERRLAHCPPQTCKDNAKQSVLPKNKEKDSSDWLYPIKSYHDKLEILLPGKCQNDAGRVSYDVWFQPLGVDHMEKVKARHPFQSVTLDNLRVATFYEVLVTKRVNGEQMSMNRQFASTTPFGPPEHFTVKRDSDGVVHLEWEEPSVIAPEYHIESYIVTVSNFLECDIPQGKQFPYGGACRTASIPLDSNASYVFRVEALCTDHTSEPSSTEILMPKHKMLKEGIKLETKGKPIYVLHMNDNSSSDGKLCRKELGKPHVPGMIQKEKVILVVGATGSGKTTWINGILNYILDVKYTDNFRFKLVIDEGASDQAVSQTQHITIYTLHHQEGFTIDYTLTIIDTPGFGDTRGILKDKEIEAQLRKIFDPQNGAVDHIDAVGFVAAASSARLTPTQKYIFTSILSLFGIDIGENIYMLFTFADGKPPQMMAAIKAAHVPYQDCFKFNNSAIFDDIGEADEDNCEMDDESEYFNRMFWDLGFKSFNRFLSKIFLAQAKSLTLTRDVLNERERMELNVENLNLQVRLGLSKMDQLKIEESLLKKFEDAIESNKDYTYEIKRLEVKKIPIPDNRNTTTCLTCNFTCHKDCAIPNDSGKAGCWAMSQGICTQCPNRCVWNIHRNICYILEQTVLTETSTLADLKARYEDASNKKLTAEQIFTKVHEELEALETQIKSYMSEISTSLNKLQQIALKHNPMSQIEYLDILIESEMNEAQPGWKERLRGLRDLRQQAQNVYDIYEGEYDPFKAYREEAEKARLGGCDMRHTSTWVTVSNRVKNAVGKVGSFFGIGKSTREKQIGWKK